MPYADNYRSRLIQLQHDHATLAFEWAMIRFGMALDRAIRAEEAALDRAFNPNQPRVPAGRPDGGQWTDGDDAGAPQGVKPSVTVHSNERITIHYPDGSTQTRIDGSRSWRNNNPGNIEAGSFANRHRAIGNNHGFAVFPDEKTGQAASVALLKTSTYRNLTVDGAIYRRSPPSENDTDHLQEAIRRIGGFSGDEMIRELGDRQLERLVKAIKIMEGWRVGTIIEMEPPQ